MIQLQDRRRSQRTAALFAAMLAGLSLVAGACGGTGTSSVAAISGADTTPVRCGMGTGAKATGDPITLGAIVTKQPGIDFTDITGMARAYFECVNDNGGINGHPVRYIVEVEQSNPQQVAADAATLIDDDKVLALVASTSLTDCTINHQFYEQRGYNVIVAGVPDECFTTPNISAVNMGPYYSDVGAAQYLVSEGVTSLVALGSNIPSGVHDISGVAMYAKSKGIPSKGAFLENLPVTDAVATVQKVVDAAGDGGGVVISFTPPEGLKILKAAEQLGMIDRVKWAWNTPGNDASVVQALGPAWNGKLGVNAELNLSDSTGPDNVLYQKVTKRYAPTVQIGSFGQMGFVAAEIITKTLLALPPGQLNPQAVNAAIRRIKNFKTDIECKPWYFGDLPYHAPDNADRTVVPNNHAFAQKQGCFDIAALPGNDLAAIRQAEKEQGLNGT